MTTLFCHMRGWGFTLRLANVLCIHLSKLTFIQVCGRSLPRMVEDFIPHVGVKSIHCHTNSSIPPSCSLPWRTCYAFIGQSLHFLRHQCLYNGPSPPPSFSFFQSKHSVALACLLSTTFSSYTYIPHTYIYKHRSHHTQGLVNT